MPGNRASENGDYITPRKVYREVAVADADDPTSGSVPILDTRLKDRNYQPGNEVISFYGRNAQIDVAVFLRKGASATTLKLYLLAEVELKYPTAPNDDSSSSSSSSSSSGGETEWVLVETKSVSYNLLWVIQNIPPGQYKILATSITGGEVELRTQHAA
jgi:hypothetical protein